MPNDKPDDSYLNTFGETYDEWKAREKAKLARLIGGTVLAVAEAEKFGAMFGLVIKTANGETLTAWAFEDDSCKFSGHMEIMESLLENVGSE